jgi:putative hydrolase of the HAD superfamily
MIKAVIFDLDDTVITSNQHIQPALRSVFSRCRDILADTSEKEFLKANQKAFQKIFIQKSYQLHQAGVLVWYQTLENLNLPLSPQFVYRLYREMQLYTIEHVKLQAGFLELLNYLKRESIAIAVLSNGSFIERIEKLKGVGILNDLTLLISSDLVGFDKPHENPFRFTLEKLGVSATEAMYVGDSLDEDIRGAINLGIVPVLFTAKDKIIKQSLMKKIQHVASNHKEIVSIIKNYNNEITSPQAG